MSKWEMVRLGDVCTIERGGSPRPISDYITEDADGVNWIKIGDAKPNSMYINRTKERIKPEGARKSRFVQKGDFILSNSMSFGKPYILNVDGCIHDGWLLIRDNNNTFDKRFLYYSLGSPLVGRQFKKFAVGGVVNNLNSNLVRNTEIPLPPLEVQNHIADTLDKTQEIINCHKKQLEGLDNLIKATFYNMFGDPFDKMNRHKKVPLSSISVIVMGQSPQSESYNNEGLGVPLLNGPTEFGLVHPIEKQWTNKPKKLCEREDILFCVRGATAGRMNYADKQYCIGRGLAAIRVNDIDTKEYIYSYLGNMYDYFQSTSNGSTFINISKDQLENLPIICPNKEKQIFYAKIVNTIEQQKAIVKRSITESQNLFNSLMSKYFD